jgi:hypothetical protein
LSDGVLADLPVFTPGSALGASAASAGAAAKSAARAVAAIIFLMVLSSFLCLYAKENATGEAMFPKY